MTKAQLKKKADELGRLDAAIAPLAAKKAAAEHIRAELRAHFDSKPADWGGTIEGADFIVPVGPKENQTAIRDMGAVLALVGQDTFVARAAMTLKTLQELATPDQYKLLVATTRTGSRPIKTFPRSK